MFKNKDLILSQEEATDVAAVSVVAPDVLPADDRTVTITETPNTAEVVSCVVATANDIITNQAETTEYLQAAESLEEIAQFLITRLETAEGTLTPQEVVDVHSRVAVLTPRASNEPVTLLIPSVEAFGVNPSLALESAVDSVVYAVKKVWEQIVKAIKATIQAVRNFWDALLRFFKIRKAKNKANAAKIHLLDSMPTHIRKEVEENDLTLKERHVRNFWINSNNNVSKDPARDILKLSNAYGKVQSAHDAAVVGWGHELVLSLKKAATDSASATDRADIQQLTNRWDATFNSIVREHEGKILSAANQFKGSYIGCIEIRESNDPYEVLSTRVPNEADIPMPSPAYLKELNDAFSTLHDNYEHLYYSFEPTIKEIERTVADVYAMIGSELSRGVVSRGFSGVFDKQLRKFGTAFNNAQKHTTRIAKRFMDIGATVDVIVTDVSAYYDEIAKDQEKA